METETIKSLINEKYKPIIKDVEKIVGFSVSWLNYKTKTVKIASRGYITSNSDMFPKFVEQALNFLKVQISLSKANNLLAIIDENNKARIYIDNFPIQKTIILNSKKGMYSPIYENEIEDIISVQFKDDFVDLTPENGSKIICLLREKFSFILLWDFTGELKRENLSNFLASECSKILFTNAYKFFEPRKFINFIKYGWYPFAGLTENELRYLIKQHGKPTQVWLKNLLKPERLDLMLENWSRKEIFRQKEPILKSGIDSFKRGDYIASIKTLTSEIEGLIAVAHSLEKNKDLKYKDEEVRKYLKEKTKMMNHNKLNPLTFIKYLSDSIYKHGMGKQEKKQITRHTTSHGRAESSAYNIERNIQIILTINQLFYYL